MTATAPSLPSGEAVKSERKHSDSQWAVTVSQFLDLAREATRNFDYERALRYLESMAELSATKGWPTFSEELRFELHHEKGLVLSKLGRHGEAVAEFERLLEYCRDRKFHHLRNDAFLEMGQLLSKTGEHDRALGFVHRALSGYRRQGDSPGICRSLRNLGVVYTELGEFDDAELAYEEAIGIARENDFGLIYADLCNNLGAIMNIKGDWQTALDSYSLARELFEQEGEVRKSGYTLNNIGITLMEQEKYEKAHESFLSALRAASAVKDESLLLTLNINLAELAFKLGNYADAKRYCSTAETYFTSKGLRNSQLVETMKFAARIAIYEKDYPLALQNLDGALDLCDELGLQYAGAEVLFEKGNLLLLEQRDVEALQVLERAIKLFNDLQAAGKAQKTEALLNSVEDLYLRVFESMASRVDEKDPYTKGHSDRVAALSHSLAVKLGLSYFQIKTVVAGALLHDIGKLNTPIVILRKTGKLLPEEFEEIKKHPDMGTRLLSGITLPWEVVPLIRHHHEKSDGQGYPGGLSGDSIPMGARIIAVADVFDALTSERPYRPAHSPTAALEIMRSEMSSSFDLLVLDTFVDLVECGCIDHIINQQTGHDELYRIWMQCREWQSGKCAQGVGEHFETPAENAACVPEP
jgi:putative nucleotidyltransferase with HDIG domain